MKIEQTIGWDNLDRVGATCLDVVTTLVKKNIGSLHKVGTRGQLVSRPLWIIDLSLSRKGASRHSGKEG